MRSCKEVHRFTFNQRRFFILRGKFEDEDTEYLQLTEDVSFIGAVSKHFDLTGDVVENPEPLALVRRSQQKQDIEVSMQYEGMPLEILLEFLSFVRRKWRDSVSAEWQK